jgi:hypothetical protein
VVDGNNDGIKVGILGYIVGMMVGNTDGFAVNPVKVSKIHIYI